MQSRVCFGLTFGQFVLLLLVLLNVGLTLGAKPKRCRKKDKATGECISRRRRPGQKRKEVAPFWKKKPPESKVIAREEGNARLDCAIRGFPKPNISWNRNGRPLPMDKPKKYKVRRGRLLIRDIQQSDMATYKCMAKNKLGSLNFTFYVAVLENMPLKDIDVVKQPENQTAQVGDTVTFMCRSQDWPKPSVHWVRTTKTGMIIEMLEYGNSSEVLVIHNVTKDHAGVYTCFIGKNSNLRKLDATLTVIDQGETLPFEPRCSLHVRRQIMEDHSSGCRTEEPVDIHYCMGSCGRSYSIPQIVSSAESSSLNQTCSCCAGVMEKLRIVTLKCPLGESKRGFYTLLRGCSCRPCSFSDFMTPSVTRDTNQDQGE
ncbi:hypothetical protein RRG08_065464 [Elysia crispata]|uniref:Uncharacterized protein n=1 Tax=Elysia crispata TaxID=231223 RepID=A0AAE0YJG5_9GAST|nr:hypothetical protein RRG08_065464 [Elysia crispata]